MARPKGVYLDRLGSWRIAKGMTQSALARKAGMNSQLVNAIETGASGAGSATILRLADALEIDSMDLMFGMPEDGGHERLANQRMRGLAIPYLEHWMIQRGMTVPMLCRATGLGKSTVYKTLRVGRADIRTVQRLSEGLNVRSIQLERYPPHD